MKRQLLFTLLMVLLLTFVSSDLSAQCAMCKAAAEEGAKDGNLQSATLNQGIAYLLVMPYLAFIVVGYLWYRNYKRRKAEGNYQA
jgi:O-antigen ligase